MRVRPRAVSVLIVSLVLGLAPAAVFASPDVGRSEKPDRGREVDDLAVEVVSSPPDLVSGGDARLVVRADPERLHDVRVVVNGHDQTDRFEVTGAGVLEGVVDGLAIGDNDVVVSFDDEHHDDEKERDRDDEKERDRDDEKERDRDDDEEDHRVRLTLVNHPITGPMFSGPHQQPFVCSTPEDYGKAELDGPIDENCTMETKVSFKYRTTGGTWADYDPSAPRPADMATTTTMDGKTVDFVVRWERGTINRFIYSIAVLSPNGQDVDEPDLSAWNRRLIYYFQGGVAIGHYQGDPSRSRMLYEYGLSKGYAVVYSTGTKTGTHYNLELGGETAIMVKDRFVSAYGNPDYTVGVGGSGGAIQQYIYAQNHPGLIDAAIPQYSYPDMITQTISIGDCELLERWMDVEMLSGDPSGAMWAYWPNRSLLEGLNATSDATNPYAPVMPPGYPAGSSECINGWRGLSPLVLNPDFGIAPGMTPEEQAAVEWTHYADAVNIYGRADDGFAARTWDNVGVQYGLGALRDMRITPQQFLDLNANVGSWKNEPDMVQEGCPFLSFLCPAPGDLVGLAPIPDIWPNLIDPWSWRNMALSPDGGVTPAPRAEADPGAIEAAYEHGLVNVGAIEIPIIDWRHYLEPWLDMHNSRQSFSARQRMLNYDGDASNQVIWFTMGAERSSDRFDQTPMAFEVIDEWMRNIARHPDRGVAGNKPPAAVDSCFAADGSLIYAGDDAWAGVLDDRPAGPCTQAFPIYASSRIVAGAPITDDVFKCELQSVDEAIADGVYGWWEPSPAERARLHQIFPTGVCDYG